MDASSPRRRLSLALVVALVLGLGALAVWRRVSARRTPSDGSNHAAASGGERQRVRLQWPRGSRHVYDVRWMSELRVGLADGHTTEGTIDVGGAIEIRSLGPRGDITLLALRFTRVDEHVFRLLDGDVLGAPGAVASTFDKSEVWFEVASDGAVRRLLFRRDAPTVWKGIAESIVNQLSVTVPLGHGDAWSAIEVTPTGRADVRYQTTQDAPLALVRTAARYLTLSAVPDACADCTTMLDARADVTLDARGFVARLGNDESLAVAHPSGAEVLRSKTSFVLSHREAGTFEAPTDFTLDMAALEARSSGEIDRSSLATDAELLDRQIRGLTFDEVAAAVAVYGAGGDVAPGLTLRAAGLFLRDHELAAKVPALFGDAKTTPRGRELWMDVLASAGTTEAQAAMRDSLALPVASREPKAYRGMLQRFSFLERPDAASVDFVERQYLGARGRGDEPTQLASAYSLGALSAALSREGNRGRADALAAELRADGAKARTPRARAHLLTALGEARRPEDVPHFAAQTRSPEREVRLSAVRALGKQHSSDAKSTLVALIEDPDADVVSASLAALEGQGVERADVAVIEGALRSGTFPSRADPSLVSFLAKNAGAPGGVRGPLELLLARATDPEEQARIRYVLAQIDARAAAP